MIISIVGPSSVGKTKLSVLLAKKYNAIIINADATQIYQELNIGSAKVTPLEMDGVKHYLLDYKSPNEDYSVKEFQEDARKIINDNQDKNIIVVGGTGLYLKALFFDYQFEDRKNETYDDLTNEQLYQTLLSKDKDTLIHPNNRIRMINFLNRESIVPKTDKLLYNVQFIGLTMPREDLYLRSDKRVEEMFDEGLLEEVTNLYEKYPQSNILKRAIGYKEIISFLESEISLEEAKELIKKNTRHYIKRQYTWFNNQMDVKWFNVDPNHFEDTVNQVNEFIASLNSK